MGQPFSVTAALTSVSGDPIPGQTISFQATMERLPQIDATVRTDGAGTATFTYARLWRGSDEVVATATVEGVTVTDRLSHGWSADAPPLQATQGLSLQLGSVSAMPGGDLAVAGTGCPAGTPVDIGFGELPVTSVRADKSGDFETEVTVPALPLGRRTVTASCGTVTAQETVDLVVVTAMTGTSAATAVAGGAVLAWLLLLWGWLRRLVPGRGDQKPTA